MEYILVYLTTIRIEYILEYLATIGWNIYWYTWLQWDEIYPGIPGYYRMEYILVYLATIGWNISLYTWLL